MKTELLEVAFKVLKQIADHKRRTREVMLARGCVAFLECMDSEICNVLNVANECNEELCEELFKELTNEQK